MKRKQKGIDKFSRRSKNSVKIYAKTKGHIQLNTYTEIA